MVLLKEMGNAMSCSHGNISIENKKFNLTESNSSAMNFKEFNDNYENLSSSPVIKEFNLNYRQNDLVNDVLNETYWRIYVPSSVSGSCQGNIIFGAVQANEI